MAEPISITVGGNSYWGVAVVDNDLDGSDANHPEKDDIAISNDVELKFHGSTVLDSGVEIGVRIEIEGESSDDTDAKLSDEQGDETYMYVEGSFGTIRLGNDDAASAQMGTSAPYATFFYGINTPFWTGDISSGGSLSTYAGVGVGDSASIMYFSPVLNGFQFGMSYAPEAGAEARSGTASRAKDGDAYSVGARYDGAFGDAGVTISAGYTSQDVPMTDPTQARRNVMVKTFEAGGAYWAFDRSTGETAASTAITGTVTRSINVFENPDWDPDEKGALPLAEGGNKDFVYYVDNPDLDGGTAGDPDEAEHVYRYHQVGDERANNPYYVKSATEPVGRTVSDYSVGVVVSMSGVSVGGSYRNTDHDKKDADDTVQYDVGISYGEGPWVVGANYGNKSQDDDGKGVKTDTDFARLMANYNLGPGINLAGVIGQDSTDKGNDTSFAGIAMGISF